MLAFLALSPAFADEVAIPSPMISDCIANMDADPWNERVIAVNSPGGLWIAVVDDQGIIPLTPTLLKIPTEGRSLECSPQVATWVNSKREPELSWVIAASLTYRMPLYQTCFADVDGDRLTETVVMLAAEGRADFAIMVLDATSATTLLQQDLVVPLAGLGIGCGPGFVAFGVSNSDIGSTWKWNGKGYSLLPDSPSE